jgi:hypothetical protein
MRKAGRRGKREKCNARLGNRSSLNFVFEFVSSAKEPESIALRIVCFSLFGGALCSVSHRSGPDSPHILIVGVEGINSMQDET